MSLALNHVRGLSGVSLRTAQLAGRQSCMARHHDDLFLASCAGLPSRYPEGVRRLSYVQPIPSCPKSPTTNSKSLAEQPIYLRDQLNVWNGSILGPKGQHTSDRRAPSQTQTNTSIPRRHSKKASGPPSATPSEYLAQVLRETGYSMGVVPGASRSVDALHQPIRPSLQTILGDYIRHVDAQISNKEGVPAIRLDSALSKVFRDDSYSYLTTRGYDVGDVVAWAWILKSKDADEAVSRLFALAVQRQSEYGTGRATAPSFLVLYLLKQKYLQARSLRLLLIYSLHLISGQPLPSAKRSEKPMVEEKERPLEQFKPQVDSSTGMLLFARLTRHARLVWPQAMPTIATAFSRFMIATGAAKTTRSALDKCKADRAKTKYFNTFLHILSIPTKIHPFLSVSLQQQAQFELLRAMASHKPVLPLTRKSYRAVAAIQLAHKKTAEERQSAELKAPSWPPWKEERLGMDVRRGNEGMYSRAMNVLWQMREAGYSSKRWEDVCSILAGWDTDRSPTIQTRSLMRWLKSLRRASQTNPDHHAIWTARIHATRTVREAWACFLSYQDRGLPANTAIYAAMAEKLIYRQLAIQTRFDEFDHILPGDGREVYPEPASARDIIYVHTEPPVLQDFLEQMTTRRLRFPLKLLALLLRTQPDFRTGLQYLNASVLRDDQVRVLCTVMSQSSDYTAKHVAALLEQVPDGVFASFIQFLSKSSTSMLCTGPKHLTLDRFPFLGTEYQSRYQFTLLSEFEDRPRQRCHPRAFWHAIQLTKARQAPCPAAWTHILRAFDKFSDHQMIENQAWRCIYAWHEVSLALKWMQDHNVESSLDSFYALCNIFNGVVYAGLKHPGEAEEAFALIQQATRGSTGHEVLGHAHFHAMIENGLLVLKSQFDSLVLPSSSKNKLAEQSIFVENGGVDSQARVPTVLRVPSFAILHRFVRVLGAVGDDDGVLHLLQWMSRSASSLNAVADERLNGDKMRRLTLTAIRMILQGMQTGLTDYDRMASDPAKVQAAYDIITHTPGWDWPSDEEVEDYYERFKADHHV